MRTIRVALLGMKPRLRSILTDALARQEDMELMAGEFEPHLPPPGPPPDAVVCEVDDPLDARLADQLLRRLPRARALMVAGAGDRAALYELQPARMVMVDVSVDQLTEALRAGLGQAKGA